MFFVSNRNVIFLCVYFTCCCHWKRGPFTIGCCNFDAEFKFKFVFVSSVIVFNKKATRTESLFMYELSPSVLLYYYYLFHSFRSDLPNFREKKWFNVHCGRAQPFSVLIAIDGMVVNQITFEHHPSIHRCIIKLNIIHSFIVDVTVCSNLPNRTKLMGIELLLLLFFALFYFDCDFVCLANTWWWWCRQLTFNLKKTKKNKAKSK